MLLYNLELACEELLLAFLCRAKLKRTVSLSFFDDPNFSLRHLTSKFHTFIIVRFSSNYSNPDAVTTASCSLNLTKTR